MPRLSVNAPACDRQEGGKTCGSSQKPTVESIEFMVLGAALRLVFSSLCGLVLMLPAGATSPTVSTAATELASPWAPTPAASWDEAHIRGSLHVFANGQPSETTRCVAGAMHQWRVLINPDAATVRIVEVGSPPRPLALREGLLSEVHYVPDGRHALLATRSGWILRLDLEQARLVAEVRVGLVLRGAALSAPREGLPSLLAVANEVPRTLAVVDEQLKLVQLLRVADKTGRTTSRVAAIRIAKARNSFVATLMDVPELWEISYNPKAPEIALGLVHDFQFREGYFVPGYLNPQRSMLPSPALDFLLTEAGHEVLTVHRDSDAVQPAPSARLQVTHLDVRRKVAELGLPGSPALDRSLAWSADGQDRLAVPNEQLGLVSILDPRRWALLGHVRTDGPVRFLRTVPGSPWLWLDVGAAPGAELSVLRVNKSTLEIVERLAEGGVDTTTVNPAAAVPRCTP